MNTKPFNLEKALTGEPVVTRNGDKVKKVYFIPEHESKQQVMVVYENDKSPNPTSINFYDKEGNFNYQDENCRIVPSGYDLFMEELPTIMFLNVYEHKGVFYSSSTLYDTMEKALSRKISKNYLKTIEITI